MKSYIIFICTFDFFKKGRHKYTFESICLEDKNIKLNDESQKIILSTKGIMNDLDEELLEFLKYVECSNEDTAQKSKGTLVKHIHERVEEVKNDVSMEVELMTLLERDREKIEEGREEAKIEDVKNFLKLGVSIDIVIKATGLSKEKVEQIIEDIKKES